MLKVTPFPSAIALLLLISLVHSCVGDTDEKTIVIFKGETTEVSYKESETGTITKRKPNAFRVPAFVGGVLNDCEFLAVFSDAHYGESEGLPFIGPVVRTRNGNYKQWSDAVPFGRNIQSKKEIRVLRNVTAVINGNKIYVLATSLETSNDFQFKPGGILITKWDTLMFVGTVVQSTESSAGCVTINWEKEISLKGLLKKFMLFYNFVTHFVSGVGNGVVMKNGTIVFPIQIKNGNAYNQYNQASSIIYSSDNGTTWHMGRPTPFYTSEGSVVEWSDGKLLLSVRFDFGYRIMYESDDMGATWKEFAPFSRVWGNNPDDKELGSEGSAITVPVDGKNILLASHPLNTENCRTRETLQLWVGDGKRISCVGTISEDEKGEQTGNSILAHVGNKLYVTHEINPFGNLNESDTTRGEWDNVIALSPLQDFFKNAQEIVREWRRLDEWFKSKGIPADGLVGYLGNTTKDAEVWEDVYSCVNATVKNATGVEGGFRFNGSPGSHARWPVERQGQNQLYKFTDKQFTLAATIIIHNTSGTKGVSFFGVGETVHYKGILVGIGYTEDRQWFTMHGSQSKKMSKFWFLLEKEYHVAITFANGNDIVYVNGVEITSETKRAYSSGSVDFFYIGSTGENSAEGGSSCTIKNVMLFNQSLKSSEITQLSSVIRNDNEDELMLTTQPERLPDTRKKMLTTEPTSTQKNDKKESTTTKTILPENEETKSTTATTILMENENTESTTTKTILPENEETESTTTKTILPEKEETEFTTVTPSLPEKRQPALPRETTSTHKNDQPVLSTKKTRTLENETREPKTEANSIPDNHQTLLIPQTTSKPENNQPLLPTKTAMLPKNTETMLTTELTSTLKNDQTKSTTEITSLPNNHKTVPITKRKETAVAEKQKINNEGKKDRSVDYLLRKYRNTTFEEEMSRADSATVPLAFVKIMCFICSIIVLFGV